MEDVSLKDDGIELPRGLREGSKRWFMAIATEFEPSHAELRLMETACRAHDRAEQCRRLANREGITLQDRFGQTRIHPALVEERHQRDLCRRAISTLTFDAGAPA